MSLKPAKTVARLLSEAVPVKGGFLLITWKGGHLGFVDMREAIATLSVLAFLRDPDAFSAVKIELDGSAVFWIDHEGDAVDVDSESLWLRRKPISPMPVESRARARAPHAASEPA